MAMLNLRSTPSFAASNQLLGVELDKRQHRQAKLLAKPVVGVPIAFSDAGSLHNVKRRKPFVHLEVANAAVVVTDARRVIAAAPHSRPTIAAVALALGLNAEQWQPRVASEWPSGRNTTALKSNDALWRNGSCSAIVLTATTGNCRARWAVEATGNEYHPWPLRCQPFYRAARPRTGEGGLN